MADESTTSESDKPVSTEADNDRDHTSTTEAKLSELNANPSDISKSTSNGVVSKKERKRLERKRKWEESKSVRRAKTKAKRKELKARLREGIKPDEYMSRVAKKSNTMKNSDCQVGIAIDMSFNHLMTDKDMDKCIKQIHRCYSLNRKQKNPSQYFVTSFGGTAKDKISKHIGWENWDVNFTQESYNELEAYPKENIVYLTSESSNVLQDLKPHFLYVIGGLVDHNSQKGLCHLMAKEKGIAHAQLPIDKNLDMKTRKVLSIDHVFEILLNVCQGLTWQDALLRVIAPRKNAVPKEVQS